MENIELALIIVEIFYILVIWTLLINLHKKIKENKDPMIKKLFLTFLFFSFTPIQMIDILFLDTFSIENFGYKLSLGYGLAILFSSFGNIFFYSFGNLLFKEGKPTNIKIYGVISITIGLLFLISRALNNLIMSSVALLIHLVLTFYLGFFLCVNAWKIMKKIEDKVGKYSFFFIGNSGISMILCYILLLLEQIIFGAQLSILGVLSWIVVALTAIQAYIGYIQPKWFKSLFK